MVALLWAASLLSAAFKPAAGAFLALEISRIFVSH
jgi:hypothetical protein